MADATFDPFFAHFTSGADPIEVGQPHSRSGSLTVSPKDTFTMPQAKTSTDTNVSPSNSLNQSSGFLPFATGVEPSDFWNQVVADPLAPSSLNSGYGTVGEKQSLGFARELGNSASDNSHPHWAPPVSAADFGTAFNTGFDFDAMCKSFTPSALFASMSTNPFDKAFRQDAVSLSPKEDFFSAASDASGSIHSPVPDVVQDDVPRTVSRKRKWSSCSDQKRTCMTSALKILQALHVPPPACLSTHDEESMPHQPRMIDSVLSTNKEVIESVAEIAKCTCSSSSQLQLLLAIICGKLISWYRAIIRNYQPTKASTTESTLNSGEDSEDGIERVLHQPVTMGGYSCDLELESKIRAQVVFSELQHLEILIETISKGKQDSGEVASPGKAHSTRLPSKESGLGDAVQKSLSSFLQGQLEAAKADTTPVLKGIRVPA
ncbi:uncharacterized protein KY384_006777 [Bacidia gigantensis]|uniref:uncharacterized protein n=1 Tax=Bacidia gigantensis TaxID=2732470 RepID=UPI001D049EE1|nr:uncharacterized protein KY384_006777 [Bacidia gigantensis]KAG8527861.1 hypothetical protein KY384_006777 [Bacidia gigantensis]